MFPVFEHPKKDSFVLEGGEESTLVVLEVVVDGLKQCFYGAKLASFRPGIRAIPLVGNANTPLHHGSFLLCSVEIL